MWSESACQREREGMREGGRETPGGALSIIGDVVAYFKFSLPIVIRGDQSGWHCGFGGAWDGFYVAVIKFVTQLKVDGI